MYALLILGTIIWIFSELANPFFLQYWTINFPHSREVGVFLGVLTALTIITCLSLFIRNIVANMSNLRISREVCFLMTFKLMHASINNFFDRVPIGRILNRFIRDLSEIDQNLAFATHFLYCVISQCTADFIAAVYASSPIMIIFIGLYFYFSLKIQRKYMNLYREVTRLKSMCSSPMIQSCSEGMQGVATIRSYHKEEFCLSKYVEALDEFQKNCITSDALMRWFVLRLMVFSTILLLPSVVLNVYFVRTGPGIFALLMKYMIVIMNDINECLDTISNQENRMISFERCTYFANIEPEKGYRNLDAISEQLKQNILPELRDPSWPTSGTIEVTNLKVRYRANLRYVLDGISLSIPHGTKVGIVGRTGAGKSTFLSCMYRNFDEYEGDITISGKELRGLDLKTLRSSITVIPQDPYLFQDTVRNNLDPLGRKSDAELITILKDIELWPKFENEGGLNANIEQSGGNLSQGEKQLLCLSRALLFKNKLILMDEATANIDSQNEQIIQRLLKERLNDCTILMIAHRLNTILHCDKVLVLESGTVLEYGDTDKLKKDNRSTFYEMLNTYETMQQNLS
jgi:ABC-type multidrug transport system fused ATPase/permease subunit